MPSLRMPIGKRSPASSKIADDIGAVPLLAAEEADAGGLLVELGDERAGGHHAVVVQGAVAG